MRSRIVYNMFDNSIYPLGAAAINTNATSSALSDGWRRIESTASSFRCFWQMTASGLVAGKRYGVRISIRNISAAITPGGNKMFGTAGGTATYSAIGTWANSAATADKTLGLVLDCTSPGTAIIRFGIGIDAGVGTHPWSMEVGNPLFATIPNAQAVPPEFIFPGRAGIIDTLFAGQNVDGFVVDGTGAEYAHDGEDSIMIFGDSFGNEPTDWPQVLFTSLAEQRALYSNSVSGRTMLQAVSDAPNQINLSAFNLTGSKLYPAFPSYIQHPKMAVIALGVNDNVGGASLSTMQSSLEAMVSACYGSGVTRILVFDIPPWKGNVSWTQDKEDVRAAYNTWLPGRIATDTRIRLYKISDTLKDGTDPAVLLAAYDSGDHIHPNATGQAAIAAAVEPYIRRGHGNWVSFDGSMPPMEFASAAPGKLQKVQVSND